MTDPRLVYDLEAVLDLPPPRHRVLAYRLAEDVLDGHYGCLRRADWPRCSRHDDGGAPIPGPLVTGWRPVSPRS